MMITEADPFFPVKNNFKGFRLAARGIVVQNKKLLFVSDDHEYWYLPGGRLEVGESLADCVEREVYEETGFQVKAQELVHVIECFDIKDYTQKIHFFFQTQVIKANTDVTWSDTGGVVRAQKFFALHEIKENKNMIPRFLKEGFWLENDVNAPNLSKIYQGALNTHGFEILEPEF